MSLVLADRVRETTTSTGTGTITLGGAVTGFQSFSVIGNNNTTYYTIAGTSQWEVGIGTYYGGTLARDTVLSSSTGSKIDFTAGSKDVFVTYPAGKSVNEDANNRVLIPYTSGITDTGSLNVGSATLHTDSGVIAGFTASEPLYLYTSLQNTSAANTSYASYAVNDGLHTAYAELGINNSTYSYSAAGYPNNGFSTPLASFVESFGGPLVLGSWDNQKISMIINGSVNTTDAMTINTNGSVAFNGQVGTSGQVLQSNATSAPTWVTPSSGTVTSVTATSPVASTGGTTPVISMPAATTSVSGYLTSTDWTTFNGKGSGTVTSVGGTGTVNGITLTGTVTSSGNLTLGGTLANVDLATQVTGNLPVTNLGSGTSASATTFWRGDGTWATPSGGGGGSGTVTSVAATVPSFLSVTGSPITTSGTLAIAYSGTALPVANGGTGQTTASAAFNALSPVTTTGDLIIGNGTNSATRLAIGTNAYVLTSNGTTATWAAAAGGGLTGFTAAENTTAPNATVYVDSLTSSAASTDADVAFVAKGTGATLAQVPTSTTAGGNKRGQYATDLQKARSSATRVASGNYSVITGGQSNTASSSWSFVGAGSGNSTSANYSVTTGGQSNGANGAWSSISGGQSNSTNASYASVNGGYQNNANGNSSSVTGGYGGLARSITGNTVFPASTGAINGGDVVGASQTALLIIGTQTTTATSTVLTSDSAAAGTTNQVSLPNNSAYYFRGECIAGVTGAGDTKGWYIEGVIKRGANAASTAIVGTASVTSLYADTGAATWAVTATADTTNGALKITVTGAAATTIRWACQIRTTEMTY